MRERQNHTPRPNDGGPNSWDGIEAQGELALVAHGTYHERLPVSGMTIAQIRELYGDRMDLNPESEAIVEGNPVGEDHVLRPGETLVFAHRIGAKGRFR